MSVRTENIEKELIEIINKGMLYVDLYPDRINDLYLLNKVASEHGAGILVVKEILKTSGESEEMFDRELKIMEEFIVDAKELFLDF